MAPVLEAERLTRRFRLPRQRLFEPAPALVAVESVSFALAPAGSMGIVGESGSGKSTLARLAMALDRPSAGSVRLEGEDLAALSDRALRRRRHRFQMIFQDPQGSLDPRLPVGRSIAEPLSSLPVQPNRAERHDRVGTALRLVGLQADDADRYPHEFSGGQRQRIAIARAMITRPALIVADEPTSALDMSVQAQILGLLLGLRAEHAVAFLLISHNLAVVAQATDTVAVMLRGRFVETGPTVAVFAAPAHPYTAALVDAIPDPRRPVRRRAGTAGAEGVPRDGCSYRLRCPRAAALCIAEVPPLRPVASGRQAACHFA